MKNLKQHLMILAILFVYVSCSNDDQIESINQQELTGVDFKEISQFMKDQQANLAQKGLNKGSENGNGVYFVSAFTSSPLFEGTAWGFGIPNTNSALWIDDPSDGRDRGIVLSENEMMLNWNIQNPKCFIIDFNTGEITYSNWCDENRSGLYQIRGKVGYTPYDLDGDGEYDIYAYNFNPANNGKNGAAHIKAKMDNSQTTPNPYDYPVQGDCKTPTEEIELSYRSRLKDGEYIIDVTYK